MRGKSCILSIAALALLIGAAPPGGTLTIQVGNVRNDKGRVHVDVCPEARFLKDGCRYAGEARSVVGTTTVVVHGLPPGRYAAQAFHDENSNGEVDRALFGIPKEGVGFSRDAPIRFSPPKFADAVFVFDGQSQTMRFNLRYFIGRSGPPKTR